MAGDGLRLHSEFMQRLWGALCLDAESMPEHIAHCLVYDNLAEWAGGMYFAEAYTRVVHCTVAFNEARDQWGGVMDGGGGVRFSSSIFWGNTCDLDDVQWAQIGRVNENTRFDYCCVQGWTGGFTGVGNIDQPPLFVDPPHGDFHVKSQAGRWDTVRGAWVQDEVTSPCIDAGDPATPIMHEPFPNGGVVNMGAYGGTAEASKSWFNAPVCEVIVAGDINGDCRVDVVDLALMARNWLSVR